MHIDLIRGWLGIDGGLGCDLACAMVLYVWWCARDGDLIWGIACEGLLLGVMMTWS